jgi:DNA-binding MarR family transcriptional regulator
VEATARALDPIELARDNWMRAGWDDSADGMALVTSIMRVQQVLLGRIDDLLKPFGLTFARFEVLMLLQFSRTGGLPVGKIGEHLQVHPASVTNAVSRLEDAGLVRRRPSPSDGRSVIASITADGRDLVVRAAARLNDDVFSGVPLAGGRQRDVYDRLREWRASFGDFA